MLKVKKSEIQLHVAALYEHLEVIKMILAGANVNAKSDSGQTPLYWQLRVVT